MRGQRQFLALAYRAGKKFDCPSDKRQVHLDYDYFELLRYNAKRDSQNDEVPNFSSQPEDVTMSNHRRFVQFIIAIITILSITFSGFRPTPVQAQANDGLK